ncbi:hypothetical protein SAMN04488117_104113 [Celeribacter baekdonensis]|uniref:Uncharacterized protein n=1 Tax=Celeribacter baekdonensis TaxID=875171 RepID=A0A1G7L065_9RHOB|nr:hypothetical protein SAMN04488117_104113 [Celeribacter baekdonensis]
MRRACCPADTVAYCWKDYRIKTGNRQKVMGLAAPNFIKRIAWVLPMPSTLTPFTNESDYFESAWQVADDGRHFRNGGRVPPERAIEVSHSIC